MSHPIHCVMCARCHPHAYLTRWYVIKVAVMATAVGMVIVTLVAMARLVTSSKTARSDVRKVLGHVDKKYLNFTHDIGKTVQSDLDYIGQWLRVNFTIESVASGHTLSRITLTNTGPRNIRSGSWVVYLTTMAGLRPHIEYESSNNTDSSSSNNNNDDLHVVKIGDIKNKHNNVHNEDSNDDNKAKINNNKYENNNKDNNNNHDNDDDNNNNDNNNNDNNNNNKIRSRNIRDVAINSFDKITNTKRNNSVIQKHNERPNNPLLVNTNSRQRNPHVYITRGRMKPRMIPKPVPFHIEVVKSNLHSLTPELSFKGIQSGQNISILVHYKVEMNSRHLFFPNWYVAAEGLEHRVIESTVGERLEFVGYSNDSSVMAEHDNPESHEIRYNRGSTTSREDVRYAVIPTPKYVRLNHTRWVTVNRWSWKIVVLDKDAALTTAADYLKEKLFWTSQSSAAFHCIQFVLATPTLHSDDSDVVRESYDLTITDNVPVHKITIVAAHAAGAFYGVQTLLSLLGDDYVVPIGTIFDAPRFPHRGIHLDTARNFHTVDDVTHLIDVMAVYKLNKLHLHLADDEGWRLEMPDIPELTELGSQRCHDLTETRCLLSLLGSGPYDTTSGSGFYTVSDYRTILTHAKARHVEVIPEVDMPGHARAAIKSLNLRSHRMMKAKDPLGATHYSVAEPGDPSQYKSVQGFNDNVINPCMPSTYRFIEKVIESLYDLHADISPLRVFHFGGDEVPKGSSMRSKACRNLTASWKSNKSRTANTSLRSWKPNNVKEYFADKLATIARKFPGVSVGAWADGLFGKTAPINISNLSPDRPVYAYPWKNLWRLKAAGQAYQMANMGYKVVMSQATHLYLDHPTEFHPEERGLTWATFYTDLKKIFDFRPMRLYDLIDIPMDAACGRNMSLCPPLEQPQNIVGIEVHLWSELVRTQGQMDEQLFPRTLALAERSWHAAAWESKPPVRMPPEASSNIGPRRRSNNRDQPNVKTKSNAKTSVKPIASEQERDWERFARAVGGKELRRLDVLGVMYRVPPPGVKIEEGEIRTNTNPPRLVVEYSMDGGCTWVDSNGSLNDTGTKIHLRTRSPLNHRHSRTITINPYNHTLPCQPPTTHEPSLLKLPILIIIIVLFILILLKPLTVSRSIGKVISKLVTVCRSCLCQNNIFQIRRNYAKVKTKSECD